MALLAMLATAPDGERTRSWLQDRLWGSRGRVQAQQSLRRELSSLRGLLDLPGGCLIDSDGERVWLDLKRCDIDDQDRRLGAAFLEGFDIPGEDGFEEWLRDQRQRDTTPARPSPAPLPDLPRSVIDLDQPAPGFGGRPAIAVIPLRDETGGADRDSWAEGLSEELVQRLSRLRWLPVIGASTMAEVASIDQTSAAIGRRVGAGYVLRGRISRKSATATLHLNLVETTRGQVLWSEHFPLDPDGDTDLLNEFTAQIVAILASRIENEEQVRVLDRPIESLAAHQIVWRARWHMKRFTARDAKIARNLLEQALEAYPNSAEVLTQFGWALAWDAWSMRAPPEAIEAFRAIAMRARDADPFDGRAYMLLGMADLWLRRFDTAGGLLEEAVRLNPSLINAWGNLGSFHYLSGNPDRAFDPLRTGLRLSPYDTEVFYLMGELAMAYLMLGQHELAIEHANLSLGRRPAYSYAHVIKINALAAAGDRHGSRAALGQLRLHKPDFDGSYLDWLPFKDESWPRRLKQGLVQDE